MRLGAAGAVVAATAALGIGAAAAAMAEPVTVIPVSCSVTSLTNAINFAPSDAILSLRSRCVYRLTGRLPSVTSNLTIQGNNDLITRSGGATFTALTDNGARLSINQLRMTGFDGNATNPGALNNNGGVVTITNSTFADDGGGYGGAILNNNSGSLTVTSTNFLNNGAAYGGAVFNRNDATAVFITSEFAGNSAETGGAIFIQNGHVTALGYSSSVSASTNFADNYSTGAVDTARGVAKPAGAVTFGYGGAIDNYGGTLNVRFTNFTRNDATIDGGAIWNGGGAATIDSSGFTGNFAGDDGGAIATTKSLSLSNSMLSLNRADHDGGGLYVISGTTSLSETDVYTNSAGTDGGGIYRAGGSVSLTNNSIVNLNNPNNCSGLSC